MHLSALLDCDLVAVEQTDELTLLVELTAPNPVTTAQRQPATLQVVLDRSKHFWTTWTVICRRS